MGFFRTIYYFFSRYTNPAERRVGRFLSRVNEKEAPQKMEKALLGLVQQHLAVINLWTEHRYKGYNYLTKKTRKELYQNLAVIQQDFLQFTAAQQVDAAQLFRHISEKGIDTAQLRTRSEQLAYLATIMRYLSPSRGRYVYRASSSFGRLLRDPTKEILEGDCNQIVTLYIALYAAKYDVSDLKLTLYPGHVAIHFQGVDIETTSGTFTRYNKEGQATVPVHEIVSVNLLDTTDIHFEKSAINPEVFLESARLAYVVSSHRQLVKKNLEIAYRNTVSHMLKQQLYDQALSYARQSRDHELIEIAARNGAIHAMKQKDFRGARRFAEAMQQKHELLGTINRNEAVHLYNTKQYESAIRIFERIGDREMVSRCYRGLYVQEQGKMGAIKTVEDVKANASSIRNMERYAKKSNDNGLIKHAASLVKYL